MQQTMKGHKNRGCVRFMSFLVLSGYLHDKKLLHCCITGANWNNGSNAGPFYLNVNNAVSNSNWNISARHQESIKIISRLCSLALAKNRSKHAG